MVLWCYHLTGGRGWPTSPRGRGTRRGCTSRSTRASGTRGEATPPTPYQLYDGLAYLGEEHEKVVEIYNARVAETFGRDTVCRVSERRYVNVSRRTPIIEELAGRTGLLLLHFNLTKGDVKSIASSTLVMLRGKERGSPPVESQ